MLVFVISCKWVYLLSILTGWNVKLIVIHGFYWSVNIGSQLDFRFVFVFVLFVSIDCLDLVVLARL